MTELGSRLKEARLSKGYSLDDLQEITKIQKRYLLGIEEGNYSIMPGSFYVRAFIKQYAEAVGLNADELLATYQNEVPGAQVEQVTQSMSQSPSRRRISKGPSNKVMEAMPKYIVALFIIVIIVVIVFLYAAKTKTEEPLLKESEAQVQIDKQSTPDTADKDTATPAEEKQPVEDVKEDEPTVKQELTEGTLEADGATTTYTLTGTQEMNLRIEVTGDTWVGVQNESGTELVQPQATVFNAGDVVEVDATTAQSARIRLGASGNAKVYINDELLQYARTDASTQNIIIIFNKEQ